MEPVIVVGAGIGGLTLALCLHRAGIACRVYEAVPEIKAIGVGINLLPHAMREMEELGVMDALAAVAIETKEAAFFNRFGQHIYSEPLGRAAGYAWPQLSIHRGDLQTGTARRGARAHRRRERAHRLAVHVGRTGRERRACALRRCRERRRASAGAWRGGDRLRRDPLGRAQATASARRRAALLRREHVARRDGVGARVVRCDVRARRLAARTESSCSTRSATASTAAAGSS